MSSSSIDRNYSGEDRQKAHKLSKRLAATALMIGLCVCSPAAGQSGAIATVAGGGAFIFSSNVTVGVNAPLGNVSAAAEDSQGNIYIADSSNCRVFEVSAGGAIRTVAANLCSYAIAADASGNVFVAAFNQVEKISPAGATANIAGTGFCGFSGDGGPATAATLCNPFGLAVDSSGDLFIADSDNNRIRKVSVSGIITTVAGTGEQGAFSGDGGPATLASLWAPTGVAVDESGNLFIADHVNGRIRKVSTGGTISTVAGNGNLGYTGDGGPATSASLSLPSGVTVDASGNLFIADSDNNVIRKVSAATGRISTVAGNGTVGFAGDGGPATSASLNYPAAVVVDAEGNLYIADFYNERLRMVSASGVITTLAGNGNFGFAGDGGRATSATLNFPASVAVDASGNLFIADAGNNRIRAVSPAGVITTVAGNGSAGISGDGGPGTSAQLFGPRGIAVDGSGNLFIGDTENQRVRRISSDGTITTVAGKGPSATCTPCGGFSGDGGQAISATLDNPVGVALDASGNLFIADAYNNRIRKVTPAGTISTVAGTGPANTRGGSYGGDGGPATAAHLSAPWGVAVDASGNLFIADSGNNRIRKVTADGMISTVAGNGMQGFSGDGGPATSAMLNGPTGVAVDAFGNVLIADDGNYRVRMVSYAGTISTIAGAGEAGFSGDGGPATAAALNSPNGIAAGSSGNFYVADTGNNRIREASFQISTSPSPVTVSPLSLIFSPVSGGSTTQEVSVTDPSGVPWSVSASAAWIVLTPPSGVGSGQFAVTVNASGLQAGAYAATFTISNPLASPAQETVSVSLTVATPSLSVGLASLVFESVPGGPPQSQSFEIGGVTGTAWQATATSTQGSWLGVSPPTGHVPAAVTITVAPAGLQPGSYQGTIAIRASGSAPASVTITVALSISPANTQGGIITSVTALGAYSIAADTSGNLFVADGSSQIWKVSRSGVVTSVAGSQTPGFSGDGGPATSALLNQPSGVAVDTVGNLFIADTGNNRIRKISSSGIIITLAGNGTPGYAGDGGQASSALLDQPNAVAVDISGNLFVADTFNYEVRKISPDGIIRTVAGGNGYDGPLGDGGPATAAELFLPQGVAVDSSGNFFIADTLDQRIRKVSAGGIITTVAGGGNPSSGLGDGGLADGALLVQPSGIAVDGSGNLFIADTGDNRIRKVSSGGVITTVAGDGTAGFYGDGGPAVSAELNSPHGIAVDPSGNLFIADNGKIREVSAPVATATPSIAAGGIVPADSNVNTIQPGEWVSIFGENLASSTVEWDGNFPTSLGGTSVTINGRAAYLSFVSSTQINLQTPSDTATGPVSVVVTTLGGIASSNVMLVQIAPSFLLLDSKHIAGIILRPDGSGAYGGGSYDILGPTGNSLGYQTVAAKAGDTIELFATGLGPTNPVVPVGEAFSGAAPSVNPVTLHINNVSVTPAFTGLSGAGLFQINLTVPTGIGTGDLPLAASVAGAQTQAGVVISLQ